jgi:hypothetical protein
MSKTRHRIIILAAVICVALIIILVPLDTHKQEYGESCWWNFRTKKHDCFEGIPKDFVDYMPQVPAALNMYSLLINKMGKSPIDAYLEVMDAFLGKNELGEPR